MPALNRRIRSMTDSKSTSPDSAEKRDTKVPGAADRSGGMGGADQRLRRHAAGVEAVAPHQIALDQRDSRSQAGCTDRGDEPSGARPNHNQVIAAFGLGVRPVLRMHVADQQPVVAGPTAALP